MKKPRTITANQKTISEDDEVFYRAMETKDFIFYVNFLECDDNGNVKMFRKKDLELLSDNYFGNQAMFECFAKEEHTWLSPGAKREFELWKEATPDYQETWGT